LTLSSPNVRSFLIASQSVLHPPLPLHAFSVCVAVGHVAGITQQVPAPEVTPHVAMGPTLSLQNAPPAHFGVPFEHFSATPSPHCVALERFTPAAAASSAFQYVW
jgi:hypothetical protein